MKECAISCMAAAVAALGDALGADVAQVRLCTTSLVGTAYSAHLADSLACLVQRPSKLLGAAGGRLTKPPPTPSLAAPSWPQVGALAEEFAELPPRAAGRAKKRANTEHKKSPPAAKAAQPAAAAAGDGPEVGFVAKPVQFWPFCY